MNNILKKIENIKTGDRLPNGYIVTNAKAFRKMINTKVKLKDIELNTFLSRIFTPCESDMPQCGIPTNMAIHSYLIASGIGIRYFKRFLNA